MSHKTTRRCSGCLRIFLSLYKKKTPFSSGSYLLFDTSVSEIDQVVFINSPQILFELSFILILRKRPVYQLQYDIHFEVLILTPGNRCKFSQLSVQGGLGLVNIYCYVVFGKLAFLLSF